MATYNNFKSTTVRGTFQNSDYADNSIQANAIFDRNASIKGDLYLGTETSSTNAGVTTYTDTNGNIKFYLNGVLYTITPTQLLQLSNTLANQSWVTSQITTTVNNLLNGAPGSLDTLYELANALGNDPNFATTVSGNIGTKASLTNNNTYSGTQTYNGNITYTGTLNSITPTTLSYISTLSSNAQTQINTLTSSKLNSSNPLYSGYLYAPNNNGTYPTSTNFLAIGGNLSAGHGEGNFINVYSAQQTAGLMAFNFSKLLTASTKSDLLKINNNGDCVALGIVTASDFKTGSITSLNTTISSLPTTYQTISGMSSYLTTANASTTYQPISGMSSYLTTANASTTYQPLLLYDTTPISLSTKLIKSGDLYNVFNNYQLTSGMSSYLTTANASTTYQPLLLYDTVPTSGSTKMIKSGDLYTALSTYQPTLSYDTTPTSLSTKLITSGNLYTTFNNYQLISGMSSYPTLSGSNTFSNTNVFNGNLTFSSTLNSVSPTVFSYISGLTSSAQTQINTINTNLNGITIATGVNNGWYKIGTLSAFNNYEFPAFKITLVNRNGEINIYGSIGNSSGTTTMNNVNCQEISTFGAYIYNGSNIGYVITSNAQIDFYINFWQYFVGNVYFNVSKAIFTLANTFIGATQPTNFVAITNNISEYKNISLTGSLTATSTIKSNNLLLQGDNTNAYIRPTNANSTLYLGNSNNNTAYIDANGFHFCNQSGSQVALIDNTGSITSPTITTINNNITTANTNISTLQGQMTTANTNISTLQGQMTTANTNISTLQGQMTTANTNISTLQSQMTTANTNISTLQSQMTTANTNITNLQNKTNVIGTRYRMNFGLQSSAGTVYETLTLNSTGTFFVIAQINNVSLGNPSGIAFHMTLVTTDNNTDKFYMNGFEWNGAGQNCIQVSGIFTFTSMGLTNNQLQFYSSNMSVNSHEGGYIEAVRII